jgi:hypothetical protein
VKVAWGVSCSHPMSACETKEPNQTAIGVVHVETDHLAGADAASAFDSSGKEIDMAVVSAASSGLG